MCEFLVRRSDNRIIRCEPDGFAWSNSESRAVFNVDYPWKPWPGKLALIYVPGISKSEGESLIENIIDITALNPTDPFVAGLISLEWWQLMMIANG